MCKKKTRIEFICKSYGMVRIHSLNSINIASDVCEEKGHEKQTT